MYTLLVLMVSIAPAFAFLLFILRMDRQEPEPLRLVMKVMALGAASALVAVLVEMALGRLPIFRLAGLGGAAVESFIEVAPVEELCKLGVVLLFVWKRPEFNEENDGIVYLGASAIGFALLENIFYVFDHGIGVGVMRAFTAIPLHVFTAVVLGLHVGRARLMTEGTAQKLLIARGFAFAWLFHGLYDTFAKSQSALALLLLPLIAGLATFGIVTLKKGRTLSLARWAPVAPAGKEAPVAVSAPSASSPVPSPGPARRHVWMAVLSRLLLAACFAFWLLLGIGIAFPDPEMTVGDAVLGGILITIIPASLGTLLEIGYRRRKRLLARGVSSQTGSAPGGEGSHG